jgi:hypothetical protein
MLNNSGFKEQFTNSVIYVFTGPPPANADAAVQGTQLGRITVNAGAFSFGSPTSGLNFGNPADAVVAKATAENWQMVGTAAGTAGWFRLMGNAFDDLAASVILPRFDGSIALSGGDLNLSTITIAIGTPVTVDVFQFGLPVS